MKKDRVLVLGFGNPGRRDDGLGPEFAKTVERLEVAGVDVDANYQLAVEDAKTASEHDIVVFVDADVSCDEPYYFRPLTPDVKKMKAGFSSHSMTPEEVLVLAKELFNPECRGYILGIRGYEFDIFKESLTDEAEANLRTALAFFEPVLREQSFEVAAENRARLTRQPGEDNTGN